MIRGEADDGRFRLPNAGATGVWQTVGKRGCVSRRSFPGEGRAEGMPLAAETGLGGRHGGADTKQWSVNIITKNRTLFSQTDCELSFRKVLRLSLKWGRMTANDEKETHEQMHFQCTGICPDPKRCWIPSGFSAKFDTTIAHDKKTCQFPRKRFLWGHFSEHPLRSRGGFAARLLRGLADTRSAQNRSASTGLSRAFHSPEKAYLCRNLRRCWRPGHRS